MRNIIYLSYIFLTLAIVSCASDNNSSKIVKEESASLSKTIQLQKGYAHFYFSATNNFLGYYKSQVRQIHIHNLGNGDHVVLNLRKGNGPKEVQTMRGLQIIGSVAYIYDISNAKLVRFDIEREAYLKDIKLDFSGLDYISSFREHLYGKGLLEDGIFWEIDTGTGNMSGLPNSADGEILKKGRHNYALFDGPFMANGSYLIYTPRYEPKFTIYRKDKELITTYSYENIDPLNYPVEPRSGRVIGPPGKVSLKIHDACLSPAGDTVYILAEGSAKNRKFKRNEIYKYDIMNQNFAGKIFLGNMNAHKIKANEKYLIVYDNQSFKISFIEYE